MSDLAVRLDRVRARIADACQRYGRLEEAVRLLAVSKTQSAETVDECHRLGQTRFGENHLQEALTKMAVLANREIEWHFIGTIQSNKTREVAENFHWAHSVDRLKIAQRLSAQRPDGIPPLQICLQVNVSGEATKSGIAPNEVCHLARQVEALPRLRVRGLMAIPAPSEDFAAQREAFRELRLLQEKLIEGGLELDTLSMGMTADLEAAIAEGSTMLRIGTAIFGPRTVPRIV